VAACAIVATSCANGDLGDTSLLLDPSANLIFGTVSQVHDGDSFDLQAEGGLIEVRMIGVNANERGECFADAALDYLIDKLVDTRVGVEIVARDQFGRALANVWHEEELVNLTLVATGLAIAQTPDPANPHGVSLVAAEETAFESGLGIWSTDACGSAGPLPDVRFDLEGFVVDPPGPDGDRLDDEYVVLANHEVEIVDITGWILRDESSSNRLVFPEASTLAPGERIEVRSGCAGRFSWCAGSPIWNNDGDMALLLDDAGNFVARARY
jgi:endonuclease YncB( thermonuclease family)